MPPVVSDTSGTRTGTTQSLGAHSIGDTSISVDGGSGTLKAGDFIKFASHGGVYMITADLDKHRHLEHSARTDIGDTRQ